MVTLAHWERNQNEYSVCLRSVQHADVPVDENYVRISLSGGVRIKQLEGKSKYFI